jgi:hypothetical protein
MLKVPGVEAAGIIASVQVNLTKQREINHTA